MVWNARVEMEGEVSGARLVRELIKRPVSCEVPDVRESLLLGIDTLQNSNCCFRSQMLFAAEFSRTSLPLFLIIGSLPVFYWFETKDLESGVRRSKYAMLRRLTRGKIGTVLSRIK